MLANRHHMDSMNQLHDMNEQKLGDARCSPTKTRDIKGNLPYLAGQYHPIRHPTRMDLYELF